MSIPVKQMVIVGDRDCGKLSLVTAFSGDKYPGCSVPRAFVELDGKEIMLNLVKVANGCDRLRYLHYDAGADVILICFSIDSPKSLTNLMKEWKPEADKFVHTVPIILVGNKKDLRNDPETILKLAEMNQEPVKFEEGRAMADQIGAFCYLECSTKTEDGVRNVLETAAKTASLCPPGRWKHIQRKHKGCLLL